MTPPPIQPPPMPDILDSWWPFAFAIAVGVIYAIRQYFRGAKCPPEIKKHMKDKIIVITGGSGSIAREVALVACARGARVVLGCRDVKKGEAAAESIKSDIKRSCSISVLHLDLTSFDSVNAFAREIAQNYGKVDVLINNAAVMFAPFKVTDDGFEEHWQVNYMGHVLLTNLLEYLIKKSDDGRIINVSAVAHFASPGIKLDVINEQREAREQYADSKLALVMHTKYLARYLQDTDVKVYAVHPGVSFTDLFRHTPMYSGIMRLSVLPIAWFVTKYPEDAAQSILFAMTCEDVPSGSYIAECAVQTPNEAAMEESAAEDLHKKTLDMLKKNL